MIGNNREEVSCNQIKIIEIERGLNTSMQRAQEKNVYRLQRYWDITKCTVHLFAFSEQFFKPVQ